MSRTKSLNLVVAMALLGPAASSIAAGNTGAQCRGVAAGVVATMRAAGELPSQEMVDIARTAAHRACEAASESQAVAPAATSEEAAPQIGTQTAGDGAEDAAVVSSTDEPAAKEPTIWELLSRDRDLKPGNERLRRLKQ